MCIVLVRLNTANPFCLRDVAIWVIDCVVKAGSMGFIVLKFVFVFWIFFRFLQIQIILT